MSAEKLSRVDLNLLVVLDVLLREQSVSRTAERLNLTSSAVSHALRRLRTLFDNELLVRDGRGMVPTARGRALAEVLPGLLGHIERTLDAPEPFDPKTSRRVFRLVAPDFVTPLVIRLFETVGRAAPDVRVELLPFTPEAQVELKQGRCDALIAPSNVGADGLRGDPIGRWSWAVFGRRDHPAFSEWSMAEWASYPHLKVRGTGPEGKAPIDLMAAKEGIARKVGAVVPNFSTAASVLAQTDMLLTVPTVALSGADQAGRLAQKPAPFSMPDLELSLFWSAIDGDESDVRWFLDMVKEAASHLAP